MTSSPQLVILVSCTATGSTGCDASERCCSKRRRKRAEKHSSRQHRRVKVKRLRLSELLSWAGKPGGIRNRCVERYNVLPSVNLNLRHDFVVNNRAYLSLIWRLWYFSLIISCAEINSAQLLDRPRNCVYDYFSKSATIGEAPAF